MFNSGTLLELATQLLGIETMAVTLLDGNREVTRVATGFINLEATSKAPGSCRWVLLPTSHHMVIVEDTLRNPRQAPLIVLQGHSRDQAEQVDGTLDPPHQHSQPITSELSSGCASKYHGVSETHSHTSE